MGDSLLDQAKALLDDDPPMPSLLDQAKALLNDNSPIDPIEKAFAGVKEAPGAWDGNKLVQAVSEARKSPGERAHEAYQAALPMMKKMDAAFMPSAYTIGKRIDEMKAPVANPVTDFLASGVKGVIGGGFDLISAGAKALGEERLSSAARVAGTRGSEAEIESKYVPQWVLKGAENLGNAGVKIAAGTATGVSPVVVFGADAYARALDTADEHGLTGAKKYAYAGQQAAINAVLGLVAGKLFGNAGQASGQSIAQVLKNAGKEVVKEFPEMAGTNFLAAATDKLYGVDQTPMSLEQVGHILLDSGRDALFFKAFGVAKSRLLESAQQHPEILEKESLSRSDMAKLGVLKNTSVEQRKQLADEIKAAQEPQAEAPKPVETTPKPVEEKPVGGTIADELSADVQKAGRVGWNKDMLEGKEVGNKIMKTMIRRSGENPDVNQIVIGIDVHGQKAANDKLGNERADREVLGPGSKILLDEVRKIDPNALFNKHGSDEWNLYLETKATPEDVLAAGERANVALQDLAEKAGVPRDMENPRAKKPKYNREALDPENQKIFDQEMTEYLKAAGFGLRIGVVQVKPDMSVSDIMSEIDRQHDGAKKKGLSRGVSRKAEAIGAVASEGQAGRTSGGTRPPERGVRPEVLPGEVPAREPPVQAARPAPTTDDAGGGRSTAPADGVEHRNRPAGEGSGLQPSRSEVPAQKGNVTQVRNPALRKPTPAYYAAMEAKDLLPSHDFTGPFPTPNKPYPKHLQPRGYGAKSEDTAKVYRFAGEKAADLYINNSTALTDGPPTVDSTGLVIAGNGRTGSLQHAAAKDDFDWYKSKFISDAYLYGIDPRSILDMEYPVLVRVVDVKPESKEAQDIASGSNVSNTYSQSGAREAAQLSNLISDEVLDNLRSDPDGTFSTLVNDASKGRAIRDSIAAEIPASQRGRYFSESGMLTEDGKTFVENMFIAKVLPIDTLEAMTPAMRKKIEAVVPQLVQIKRGDGPNIAPAIDEALKFIAGPLEGGKLTVGDYRAQASFDFDKKKTISPRGEMMIELLDSKPTVLRKKLATMIKESQVGENSLLAGDNPETEEQMIRRIVESGRDSGIQAYAPKQPKVNIQVNTGASKSSKPISNQEIADEIRRDLEVPLRAGNLGGNAAGVYKLDAEAIRTKKAYVGDLGVVTHEAAHHVDKTLKIVQRLPNHLAKELGGLDYEPKKARPEEGFAEYIRSRLTGDKQAVPTPQFDAAFNDILKRHPDLAARLVKWKGLIDQWRIQSPEERVEASRSNTGESKTVRTGDKIARAAHEVNQAMLDRIAGLREYTAALQKQRVQKGLPPLRPGQTPETLARIYSGSAGAMADNAISEGVFSLKDGRRLSEGIAPALESLKPSELEPFTNFAQARHSLDVLKTGRNPGMLEADAKAIVEKYKNREDFVQAADALTKWNKAIIKMLAEASGISKEAEQFIQQSFPNYLPIKRAFADEVGRVGGRGGSPLKRMSKEGSGAEVINPIAEMIRSASAYYGAAQNMMVKKAIIESAESVGGMGTWVERITDDSSLHIEGLNLSDNDMSTIQSLIDMSVKKPGDKTKITYYKNGKPETYQLHPDLADAVNNIQRQALPGALETIFGYASHATAAKRAGAVLLRPSFALFFNPARDLPTATIQTEGRAIDQPLGFLGSAARIFHTTLQNMRGKPGDPWVELVKKYGGESGQELGQDISRSFKKAKDVINDAESRKKYGIALHVSDFQRLLGTFEGAPRLTEFRKTLERGGVTKQDLIDGKPIPSDVLNEALLGYKQVTTDFSQGGTIGSQMNRVEAFTNAAIQGIYQPVQRFGENPKRFAARAIAMLTVPTVAYWLMTKDEDWYKEQPAWLKVGFWSFKTGNGEIVRIPKPFEIGSAFSSMPEALLDSWQKEDPSIAIKTAKAIAPSAGSSIDKILPDLVQPLIETWMNFSLFRERNIVGKDKERFKPKDQYYAYNSSFSKWMGGLLNASPAKLDYMVEQYTGGIGRDILVAPDRGISKPLGFDRLFRDTRRGESVNEFYDAKTSATQERESAKLNGTLTPEIEARYRKFNEMSGLMSKIRDAAGKDENKQREFQRYITGLAMNALGKPNDSTNYPNIFKNKNLPTEIQAVFNEWVDNKVEVLARSKPLRLQDQDRWRAETADAVKVLRGTGATDQEIRAAYRAAMKGKKATAVSHGMARVNWQLSKK